MENTFNETAHRTTSIEAWGLERVEKIVERQNKRILKFGYEGEMKVVVLKEWNAKSKTPKGPRIPMITLRIDGGAFTNVGGWEFLAVLDHLDNEHAVVRSIGEETDVAWSSRPPVCEHCNTKRHRNRTILVRKDGEIKQVATSCVQAYTSLHNISSILMGIHSAMSSVETCGDEDGMGSYGGHVDAYPLDEVIAGTLIVTEGGTQYTQGAGVMGRTAIEKVKDPHGKLYYREATDEDYALAAEITEWAKAHFANPTSSYAANLNAVLGAGWCKGRHLNIVGSVVLAYAREKELLAQRKAAPVKLNEYKVPVGEVVDEELILVASPGFDTQFGYTFIHKFEDTEGRVVVWKTTTMIEGEVGDRFKVRGKVKAHNVYQDTKQTMITRARIDAVQVEA